MKIVSTTSPMTIPKIIQVHLRWVSALLVGEGSVGTDKWKEKFVESSSPVASKPSLNYELFSSLCTCTTAVRT